LALAAPAALFAIFLPFAAALVAGLALAAWLLALTRLRRERVFHFQVGEPGRAQGAREQRAEGSP
jgi:hypothetical protein